MDATTLLPASLSPRPKACQALPGKPRRTGALSLTPHWSPQCGLDAVARERVEAHWVHRGLRHPGEGGTLFLAVDPHSGPGPEHCQLRLWQGGGEAIATDEGGLHRAVELVAALADSPRGPALELKDQPLHAWRGLMLDCARHFWSLPMLLRVVDEVARHGGNRLHLHLTDDQGWRLPLPGRPQLEEVGAWRLESDGKRHGGSYSPQDLRCLVDHGRMLGVELLPEVDLPGHCGALLAALPELSCHGSSREVPRAWGCHEALLCLGNPLLPDFLDEILDALVALFPFPHIHLGGDEVPSQVWARCPRCRERMSRSAASDPASLAAGWLELTEARLAAHGRAGAYWDEALDHLGERRALIFAWRGEAAVSRALESGHPTVACPLHPCYLDFYPALEAGQPRAIGGFNHWRHLRSFLPGHGGGPACPGALLGGQGNLWTEYVDSDERLMERLQPRLAALMEALWRGPEASGEEEGFSRRLPAISRKAWSRGWKSRVDAPRPLSPPLALPGKALVVDLELWPEAQLESSTDGLHWVQLPAPRVELPLQLDSLRLQLRQRLGESVVSQILPLQLRREKPWPALNGKAPETPGAVACRWLCAPREDWRRVAVDPRLESWTAQDLDWPRERLKTLPLLEPGHCPPPERPWSIEAPTPELPEIAPPGARRGLSREWVWTTPRTGRWHLLLHSYSLARLWLDGRLVLDQDGFRPGGLLECWIPLEQGRHPLRLDWLDLRGGECRLELHFQDEA